MPLSVPPYTPLALLGEGGFAEVHSVVDALGQQYAQKTLTSDDGDDIRRFSREVKLLQSLDHPNIVQVLDAQLDTSPYWFIMPLYVRNLRQELATRRAADHDYTWIDETFRRILDGVEYMHDNDLIHRDLKPENVLLSDTDLVLADFGLGRRVSSDSFRHTRSTDALGTLSYCAPEQYENSKVHGSSFTVDIYSLGKIFYDFFVNRPSNGPFNEELLPASFRALYKRATAWAPESRYQTIAEFRSDYEQTMNYSLSASQADMTHLLAKFGSSQDRAQERQTVSEMLLAFHAMDTKEIFDTFLTLPPDVFAALEAADITATRTFTNQFCDYARNHPGYWSFEFTDEIGDAAERLFLRSRDEEMRGALTEMTFGVGIAANRFYVMATLGNMLEAVKDQSEIAYLSQRFSRQNADERERARLSFRDDIQLPTALRRLFPKK
jgi:serine/threonine protein kinase